MRGAAAALAALTVIRLLLAATLPLAPDEAYYWTWSHVLAPGYLDHPPMVALWIAAGTAIAGQGALGVRLLGPLSAALGAVLLADAAERLAYPESKGFRVGCARGWWGGRAPNKDSSCRGVGVTAAALMNATLLVGVGSVIMTPDTPLLFFWTASLWAVARLVAGGGGAWWLAVGGFAGLALASKYTAVLLWAGIGLWLLIAPAARTWLSRPWPWFGAALGLVVFMPVVAWNAAHAWVGFLRQGGRVGDWRPERAAQFLLELVGGQIGLATPGIWLLCVVGVAVAARRAWRGRDPAWTLLAALTVPGALLFLQHAIGDRVQGNWPAVLYPAAVIAAAGVARPPFPRLRWPAIGLGLAITALAYVQASTGKLPIPPSRDPIALRLGGWEALAARIEAARQRTGATFVAAEEYGLAAELARLLPPGVTVVGLDRRWTWTGLSAADLDGRSGLLVRPARYGDAIDASSWADARPEGSVSRDKDGATIEAYHLFGVTGRAGSGATVLPRP